MKLHMRRGSCTLHRIAGGATVLREQTLVRAARDHLKSRPAFALDVALAALYWMARGEGRELTGDHAAAAAAALN